MDQLWAGRKLGVRRVSEDASYICHVLRRCRCIRPHVSGRALYREAFKLSCGCFTIAEYLFGLSNELSNRGSRSFKLFSVLIRWGALPTVMHLLDEWGDLRNADLEGNFVEWAYNEAHVVADLKCELLHVHALMEEHRQLSGLQKMPSQKLPSGAMLRVGEFLRDHWETARAADLLFQEIPVHPIRWSPDLPTEDRPQPPSEDANEVCDICNSMLPYIADE